MRPRLTFLIPLAALLAFSAAGPLLAQVDPGADPPTPAEPEETYLDRVEVRVVNVEVFVTDKQGELVHDLQPEDFELFEDGHPVRITHFRPVRSPPEADPVQAEPVTPVDPLAPVADAPGPPERRPLYLVVYIDNANIKPFSRNRVFRRLRGFLEDQLVRGDKVAVLSYNRTLKQRVPFTTDPSRIHQALFEIEDETGLGVQRETEWRQVLRTIDEASGPEEAAQEVKLYASNYHSDLMFTIDALRETVTNLGGLLGRKAIVYVSDGLPMVPGEELYSAVQDKFLNSSVLMESREFDSSRRFRELAHQANTYGVTFYTIDAAGLRAPASVSAASSRAGFSPRLDSQTIFNLQSPLLLLARETGGRAIMNTNDVGEDLALVAQDFTDYYSLGYQPAHTGEGRYHRLEVKVNRPGLKLRHRQGYRDRPLDQRLSDATMAALMFEEPYNPMGVRVTVGAMAPREGGQFLVPLTVTVPLEKIVLLDRGDHHEGRLRILFAAVDEKGGISPVQEAPVRVAIPEGELGVALGQAYAYEFTLLMRGGDHRLALGVHDDIGGADAFVTGAFTVGAGAGR